LPWQTALPERQANIDPLTVAGFGEEWAAFDQSGLDEQEHRDLFDRYYKFTGDLLRTGLIWPALEYCLKCSHLFNILDSSGSIGVTERTAYVLKSGRWRWPSRRRTSRNPHPRAKSRAPNGTRAAS